MMKGLQKEKRAPDFARNPELEALLKELNALLEKAERQAIAMQPEQRQPLVFIVGCPRSGTTLLMQWLANSGCFAYPSNFISRFYQAPCIGAKIQLMLTDPRYAFRQELDDFRLAEIRFESELGKTQGMLAPNEFWYFWRRFFPFGEIQQLPPQKLAAVDIAGFRNELVALANVFQKPLVLKAMNMNWHLPFLAEHLPNAIFVYIKRHPFFNVQSLLQARQKFYGNINTWYSFRPPEYSHLKDRDPYTQVAGQVYYTNQAIQRGLAQIDPGRCIRIDYQEFCSSPRKLWQLLSSCLAKHGQSLNRPSPGPEKFDSTNRVKLEARAAQKIVTSYLNFSGKNIMPEEPAEQDIFVTGGQT